jgi:Zn ribbon nucleic-acid-binding protein
MSKTKIKTVTAKVEERTEYIAHTKCPYCKKDNEIEIDEEEGIEQMCWKCGKEYKVKIPKNSLL